MKCLILKQFNRRGVIQNPGSIIDIPDDMLLKLTGFVEAIATADSYPPAVWPSVPDAWLTKSGELRTQGVFDDLPGEIIKLTADDMLLQAKLLRECCGSYSGPHWKHLVEVWHERAAIMEFDGGLSRDDAEYQAAVLLRCAAFLPELRNNQTKGGKIK